MNHMASVKEQLKPIILKSLRITDLTPEDLRDDQPLLGGELEIDSIDILQLVLEIERHFGIKLVQANFDQKHFDSVNILAAIIESKMRRQQRPDTYNPQRQSSTYVHSTACLWAICARRMTGSGPKVGRPHQRRAESDALVRAPISQRHGAANYLCHHAEAAALPPSADRGGHGADFLSSC